MRIRQRRASQFGILALVIAMAVGVVIAAVNAQGRADVRANTNDGGAWLIRRSGGLAGHVNRAAAEVSGALAVATPQSDFDVEQGGDLVVVNDRTANLVATVDRRSFRVSNKMRVPAQSQVSVVSGRAIVWVAQPFQLWTLTAADLADLASLAPRQPRVELIGQGLAALGGDGRVWMVDPDQARVAVLDRNAAPVWFDVDSVGKATQLTVIGDRAVVATPAGEVTVISADGASKRIHGFPSGVVLGQQVERGPLVAVAGDGTLFRADLGDDAAQQVGSAGGRQPLAPVSHQGCLFAVVTEPPTFTRTCNGTTDQTVRLSGSNLRLRLVNGWVWVNDLDSGAMWVAGESGEVDRIDDWGASLADASAGDQDSTEQGDSTEQRNNPDSPDADFQRADQLDEDGRNDPPVARDDRSRTRVDTPLLVKATANDVDPDGDVLMITGLAAPGAGGRMALTADRSAVQVTPAPGFTGQITSTYTVSDGRGGEDSATISVTVGPNDGTGNRPPVAVKDVVAARGGANAALSVLANDTDPDGDSLVLRSVTVAGGRAVFDASGRVTITPDSASAAGTVEGEYVVADTFGATTTGRLRVDIRLDGANNEPDARHDAATGVVGRPITLNVLHNDTDPDGDALSVSAVPTLLVPANTSLGSLRLSLSEDGEMFFAPTKAGTYLLRYSIFDGEESDSALIRVEVVAARANRQPVAVRDDLTLVAGASSVAYVLQNDTDADGDVVVLSGWSAPAGFTVEDHQGIGLRVTAAHDAPSQATVRYEISDGRSDPVSGSLVIAVSGLPTVDQPPIARPDVIEVRTDQTAAVPALLNDYDPEGAPVKLAGVSAPDGVIASVAPGGQFLYLTVGVSITTGFAFGYDVVDPAGNRSSSFVQVRLVPPDQANRPPVPHTDTARTRSGATVTIPALANDTDPEGDPLRIESIAAQPAFGVATITADGRITYTAAADRSGTDRLRYVVVDSRGDRAVGEVLIGVVPANAANVAPSAVDDTFTVVAGGDDLVLDVVANDYDGNGDPLRIIRAAGNAPVIVDSGGATLRFDPPATVTGGRQSFTVLYTISDGRGGTDQATVTIDVLAAVRPEPPVAVDDVVGPLRPGQTVTADLLANDVDPDGPRAALVPRSAAAPNLVVAADGTAQVLAGTATARYRYTITDASGLSASAWVTVIVTTNVAPVPPVIRAETEAGVPVRIDVGAQVTDPDGDDLFFACCDAKRHGTAVPGAAAANSLVVSFTPDTDFAGQAGFSYTVNDRNGHVVSGAVVVTVVAPANRPPTAKPVSGTVEAGTAGVISLAGGATDPDLAAGDRLSFALQGAGAGGLRLNGSSVQYSAPIDAGGRKITATYVVTDRAGATARSTVTVTVTPSRAAPPTAVDDRARTTQTVAVTSKVTANDIDALGRGLRIVRAVLSSGQGTVTVSGGSLTYTPAAAFFGTAVVTYTVEDARRSPEGQGSARLTIDVIGLPGTPATPRAVAGNATASVVWSLPAANGSPIDAVEVQPNPGAVVALGAVSSRAFAGLTNGTPITFRVRAHNEAGWGPWSGYSAPVTPDIEPGRPAAPVVTFGDGQLTVRWTRPANQGSAITGYNLYIGGGMSGVQQLGDVTSFTWPGLTNGVSYQFTVVAKNAKGSSARSAGSNVEHPLGRPSPPGAPSVARGDQYLNLAWGQPNTNGDPIIEYQVEMGSRPGQFVSASGLSMRWSDLPNGVTQRFRVRARNRDPRWGDWGPWSAAVKPCTVPSAPATPSATAGDQQAAVRWTAIADNGCSIDQIQVADQNSSTQSAGGLGHTFAGLTNGSTYQFRVRAHNEEGWGQWSPPSAGVVPAGPPIGPNSVNAAPSGPGSIQLDWPAGSPNGSAITGYQLSIDGGPEQRAATSTSMVVSGLANSTSYGFRIRACNAVGCGAWSQPGRATTWGPPDQVATPVDGAGDLWFKVDWTRPAANGTPIEGYRVERSPGGEIGESTTAHRYTNVSYGVRYQARVRACNAVGCGPWSAWSNGATPSQDVSVTISKGASAVGQPNCSHPSCAWVVVNARGLTPNTVYPVTCHGGASPFYTDRPRTDNLGRIVNYSACYWGYPGLPIYVTVGSHRSPTLYW